MTENGRRRGTLSEAAQKELRVISSRNRSPLPLRGAKWAFSCPSLGGSTARGGSGCGSSVSPLVGLATHLLYRHKTHGWTRPWGGWKDVEAANPKES